VGWLYHYARRYETAHDHLARAIEMDPTAVETYRILAQNFAMQGRLEEAERTFRETLLLPAAGAYTKAGLGWVLGRAGKRAEAETLLAELEASAREGYVSPVPFSMLHIGLGNVERALDWAERAYAERRGWLAYFKVNPLLDPLRNEPRFNALLATMRL